MTMQGMPSEVLGLVRARFFSEEECTRWFINRYYPAGPVCPDCGAPVLAERSLQNFHALRRFTCHACGRQPFATKGTPLHKRPGMTPHKLFLLALLDAMSVPRAEIARICEVDLDTVTAWRRRFLDEVAA
jgi:transposase-like protein